MISRPELGEVRKAMRDAVAELGDSTLHSSAAMSIACNRLGINQREVKTNEDWKVLTRLDGQAKRELDAMVTEGLLVKIGKGKQTPIGADYSYARYFTPDGYTKAVARAQAAKAAERDLMERQAHVLAMLHDMEFSSAGVYDGHNSHYHRGIVFGLDDAERVLRVLEAM